MNNLFSVCLILATASVVASVGKVDEENSKLNLFSKKAWPRRRRRGEFLNFHRTLTVGGEYEELFQPRNNIEPRNGKLIQDQEFLSGLQELQNIVATAEADGKRLRAYGSKYSLNNLLYTKDYMVESWGLNYFKIGIDEDELVSEAYQPIKDRLVFVQSGVRIKTLNPELFEKGYCLITGPSTDGARVVGAVSTSTHGSALEEGGIQNAVRGIHLVVTGGEHYWLQKEAVVSEEYAASMGNATLVTDEALFNAALVSFGSFGMIHGMLIEVAPLYELTVQTKKMDYDDVRDALTTLDISKLGFEGVEEGERPFHFEITMNPYRRNRGGTYVRVIRKSEISEAKSQSAFLRTERTPIPTSVSRIFESAFSIVSIPTRFVLGLGLRVALDSFFRVRESKTPFTRYPHELFFDNTGDREFSSSPISGIGWEVDVPFDKAAEVVDLMLEIIDKDPIAAPVAVRFTKASAGTLSPIRYAPYTATIELPGAYGRYVFRNTLRVHEKIMAALEERRDEIPHAYHWGQNLPINDYWVERTFGGNLTDFQQQRDAFLGEAGREMFANELMETLKIHV